MNTSIVELNKKIRFTEELLGSCQAMAEMQLKTLIHVDDATYRQIKRVLGRKIIYADETSGGDTVIIWKEALRGQMQLSYSTEKGRYILRDPEIFPGTCYAVKKALTLLIFLKDRLELTIKSVFPMGKWHLEAVAFLSDFKKVSIGIFFRDFYNGNIVNNFFEGAEYRVLEDATNIERRNYLILKDDSCTYNLQVPNICGIYEIHGSDIYEYEFGEE